MFAARTALRAWGSTMPAVTLLPIDDPRWRAFVDGQPRATPFHHPDWAQLVADCYGFRVFAAVTTDARDAVVAGLPLVEVRQPIGRRRWVCLPFTDACPPLVAAPEDEAALADALGAAAGEAHVRSIEVRAPLAGAIPLDEPGLRHVLPLQPDASAVYAGFHPSQVQRSIRRAERERLTVRRSTARVDLLDVFYGLHLATRRRQGVPIQPRRFFELIWERAVMRGLGWVSVVEVADRPIAAALFLAWNRTVIYKFGASDADAWSLRPNHLLFWDAIRSACEEGYTTFDFGRTDAGHESLAAFKRSWGASEEPLVYSVLASDARGSRGGSGSRGTAARLLGTVIRHSPAFVCRASGELLYRFVA